MIKSTEHCQFVFVVFCLFVCFCFVLFCLFFWRTPGVGQVNEILLSRLQAGMFRPNSNVRLHCAEEVKKRRSGSVHLSKANTLSKGRSIWKYLVTSSGPASQGSVMIRLNPCPAKRGCWNPKIFSKQLLCPIKCAKHFNVTISTSFTHLLINMRWNYGVSFGYGGHQREWE